MLQRCGLQVLRFCTLVAGLVEPEPLNFGFAFAGFLAYKPALLLALWDDCLQFLVPEYDKEEVLAKYRS